MIEYPKIRIGEHKGKKLNEIPMDYLCWIFPTLKRTQTDQPLYYSILTYFLNRSIRVEQYEDKHYFYFNDYEYIKPPGVPKEFLVCDWMGIDSTGNRFYEVTHFDSHFYIAEHNSKFGISHKYISHKYLYGGMTMVYEKNSNYYFIDPFGNIINGAYLIRKPYILDDTLYDKFSDNIKHDN